MKTLESLAAIRVRRLPHCEADMSHRTTAAARTEAIDRGAETVPVETAPRWRPSEDEIVRAAITVILVALVAIIGLAAAAVLTMG
jgi:hypothetical protein